MTKRNRNNRSNRTQAVRLVDEFAGNDGIKLDRMLNQLHNSQSQVRVMCTSVSTLSTTASGGDVNGVFSCRNVWQTDEFSSLAAQFETYRIRAIRFDVYDVNPSQAVFANFSTYHIADTNNPTFVFANVIDSPDSQSVTGGNKVSFTWFAKGTREEGYQDCREALAATTTAINFGGLRWALGNSATAGSKFQVFAKALVDFKSRS